MPEKHEVQFLAAKYTLPCDFMYCRNRAEYTIGRGDDQYNTLKVCKKCAAELVKNTPEELVSYIPESEKELHEISASSINEVNKLSEYLLKEFANEITEGSAVDVAIRILSGIKEEVSDGAMSDKQLEEVVEEAIESPRIISGTIKADQIIMGTIAEGLEEPSDEEVLEFDGVAVEDMTVPQLREVCKDLKITGVSKATKDELIAAIEKKAEELDKEEA